jgi:SAM-dependent methyltransferase
MFLWQVRNVICQDCGFVFVSPCPTETCLKEYYEDSYEYFCGQELDYSIETRIQLIKKYNMKKKNTSYIEIGSNESSRFITELSKYVGEITTVELNTSCSKSFSSMQYLSKGKADIVTAYFVLEHVSNPKKFLTSCADCLHENGILILEVPNLYLYPLDPSGLLWWEHTNHFSPRSLSCIAALEGFDLLELSQEHCSRPFGFVAIFQKKK